MSALLAAILLAAPVTLIVITGVFACAVMTTRAGPDGAVRIIARMIHSPGFWLAVAIATLSLASLIEFKT